jgi:SAM-dependent methyltransferase
LELARRGFAAHAWDVSDVGLAALSERARGEGLRVTTRCVDLLRESWGAERFELVVVVNFLDRESLRKLDQLLVPGGWLCFTTFTHDWPAAKPPRAFRLTPGELGAGLPGFETGDRFEADGRAGLFARRGPNQRSGRAPESGPASRPR